MFWRFLGGGANAFVFSYINEPCSQKNYLFILFRYPFLTKSTSLIPKIKTVLFQHLPFLRYRVPAVKNVGLILFGTAKCRAIVSVSSGFFTIYPFQTKSASLIPKMKTVLFFHLPFLRYRGLRPQNFCKIFTKAKFLRPGAQLSQKRYGLERSGLDFWNQRGRFSQEQVSK